MPDLAINGGLTMADTKYRDNLVGASGKPLNDYLFQLPGRRFRSAAVDRHRIARLDSADRRIGPARPRSISTAAT